MIPDNRIGIKTLVRLVHTIDLHNKMYTVHI